MEKYKFVFMHLHNDVKLLTIYSNNFSGQLLSLSALVLLVLLAAVVVVYYTIIIIIQEICRKYCYVPPGNGTEHEPEHADEININ